MLPLKHSLIKTWDCAHCISCSLNSIFFSRAWIALLFKSGVVLRLSGGMKGGCTKDTSADRWLEEECSTWRSWGVSHTQTHLLKGVGSAIKKKKVPWHNARHDCSACRTNKARMNGRLPSSELKSLHVTLMCWNKNLMYRRWHYWLFGNKVCVSTMLLLLLLQQKAGNREPERKT